MITRSSAPRRVLFRWQRWNVAWGIPDKWFYLVGDTILEPIVLMMAFMPGTVLISKMPEEHGGDDFCHS